MMRMLTLFNGKHRHRAGPETRLLLPDTATRRATRSLRKVRALGRNLRVAWREFRAPITVFLVAIFAGGWLYGELLARAGHDRLPYHDLPYQMILLMLFEPGEGIPAEAELIVFHYLMPLVGAYVAGRGVFEAVNLFFRNEGRRNSWEEAVASTYRNHVIVLGVGHLGLRVVRALSDMGFDVVTIDYEFAPHVIKEMEQRHVPMVRKDGRLATTLETAGIRHAQALIVCTSNDHMNLEVTMRARDLNPTLRIVVRVWDDQFASQIRHFMNVEAVLSATNIAAPTFAASALSFEITQTLVVNDIEYSMIRLEVERGTFMDGARVETLQNEHDMDIVLHARSDAVDVHPPGDTAIQAGDTLVIFAQHSKVVDVVARNQRRRIISS